MTVYGDAICVPHVTDNVHSARFGQVQKTSRKRIFEVVDGNDEIMYKGNARKNITILPVSCVTVDNSFIGTYNCTNGNLYKVTKSETDSDNVRTKVVDYFVSDTCRNGDRKYKSIFGDNETFSNLERAVRRVNDC